MQMKTIKWEITEETARITFTRPEKMNVINTEFLEELGQVLDKIAKKEVRVLVLTGEGKAFCAGADIIEMTSRETVRQVLYFNHMVNTLLNRIEDLPIPIIAAINGHTLGGGLELALACDFRIAVRGAKIGLPEINLGVIPAAGGTQRLPRTIGITKAKEMLYMGEPISADEAEKIGLLNKTVLPSSLEAETEKLVESLLKKPALALSMLKEAVNQGTQLDLRRGIRYEGKVFALLNDSKEKEEGIRAFLEKREPVFK
ncbi:enoyl-CoA hydratase/isomerase family protein [Metallumcola ferriviriculae]|uniref:short-chain-enoyl-CoA hydratase n=1 Tax=Metallumcola ferriviriculae TaxID=3039180 RepID=A0AAU0UU88_9FIRM|nr:enoyl-CoA hydratase/isomerase family protein [Desulfitibacteraceae bacterium MK1]